MGVAKCTALTLEEDCDDLVGAVGGGRSLEHVEGLIILAS